MTRMTKRFALIAGTASALAGTAAIAAPTVLDGVIGGEWIIEGKPGQKAPLRQCVADPMKLAAIEHAAAKCTEKLLNEAGSTVRVSVQCGAGDFGQASIKVVTPRALRIDVQGIAGGAPYAYVVQARYAGPCGATGGKPERGRH